MRILLDYLPGSGGDAVAEAIRSKVKTSFRIDRNEDLRRFAAIEESERKRIELVYGRMASKAISLVDSRVKRIYFASEPSRRVHRIVEESAANPRSFLFPVATKLPPWKIAHKFSDLQNAMAKTLDPDLWDIIAISPAHLLRSLNIRARETDMRHPGDDKIDEVNEADVELYRWIESRCENTGLYFRNRTWHESEVAIVTAHFNPARSQRMRETFYQWKSEIGHPVQCWEAGPDGDLKRIDGSTLLTCGPENEVWQKERLINVAIANQPVHVRYVAWIDHDLIPGNPQWLTDTVEMLRRGYDALQLFSEVNYLDRSGAVLQTIPGSVRINQDSTNPGGAWIAKRKFVDSVGGLYDRAIVGGGDAIWFSGLTGRRRSFESRHSEPFQRHIQSWYGRVQGAKIGYLPGEMFHLWHGDLADRQYHSRDQMMASLGYDPERHIEVDKNGLLAWTSEASDEMKSAVRQYFADRRDDE